MPRIPLRLLISRFEQNQRCHITVVLGRAMSCFEKYDFHFDESLGRIVCCQDILVGIGFEGEIWGRVLHHPNRTERVVEMSKLNQMQLSLAACLKQH